MEHSGGNFSHFCCIFFFDNMYICVGKLSDAFFTIFTIFFKNFTKKDSSKLPRTASSARSERGSTRSCPSSTT